VKRGELQGEKEEIPQGFVWRVELPVDAPPVVDAEATTAPQAASVLAEDALEAARLRERVDGLERLVGELQGERDAWQAQAQRHEDAARELRILVRQAQELSRALPGTAGGGEPRDPATSAAQPSGAAPQTATYAAGHGLWQRLRRLLGSV